ncbi:MAG: hypothetical protein H6542_01560 [Lentimicrobiaceae bacterium]|nr:hypothetical protein [Lentimicrobiaceae bacterium]
MRKLILLTFLLQCIHISWAQQNSPIKTNNLLKVLLDSTRKVKDDSLRLSLNAEFFNKLTLTLKNDSAVLLIPDSLNIGKVTSDDGHVTIYCWNIQQNNGDNYYSAIITRDNSIVTPLPTQKSFVSVLHDRIFKSGEWPSGLFYKIISKKNKGQTTYTLLSWDRFNRTTARKSIEWLSFDSNGQPVFGAPVFKSKDGISHRIVYEYSAQASFTMNYSRQKVTLSGVRRSQRNVDDNMIVVDRLISLNENLQGQNWAMVPAGNVYDAFIFLDGFWVYTENIIARNPAQEKKPQTKPNRPQQGLFPSK